jgi:hypothetical protein
MKIAIMCIKLLDPRNIRNNATIASVMHQAIAGNSGIAMQAQMPHRNTALANGKASNFSGFE